MTEQVLTTTVLEYLWDHFDAARLEPAEHEFYVFSVEPAAENAGKLRVKRDVVRFSRDEFNTYLRKYRFAEGLAHRNEEIKDLLS